MNAKKLPSGNWRARAFDKESGKQKSFTAATKKEAEFLANEWLTGRKALPLEEKTVKQAITDYIELKKNILSLTTLNGYSVILRKNFSEELLELPMSKLTGVVIQSEVNRMTAEYSPKTVHNAHGLLSAALKIYYPDLHYSVTLPKIQKRSRQLPSAEEIIPLFVGSDVELPVLLAVWLGLRMGEIVALKKSDIVDGTLTVCRSSSRIAGGVIVEKDTTKTVESRRSLALPDPILKKIEALNSERITELSGDKIYHHFIKIMKNAGYSGVTFHDLRHVNASTMLKLGIPDKYAMERGGWSTTSTLKRVYQETFSAERINVDRKIDDYFNGIFEELDTKVDTENIDTA